jgi:hypothetical protein
MIAKRGASHTSGALVLHCLLNILEDDASVTATREIAKVFASIDVTVVSTAKQRYFSPAILGFAREWTYSEALKCVYHA